MKNKKINTENWWYCDNIIDHYGKIGLLHLNEPLVFILFRDNYEYNTGNFESWKRGVAEVNFLIPSERKGCNIDNLLTEAWNFAALQEAEDERLNEEFEAEDF